FLTEEITRSLKSGYKVKIAGLGTFKVRERKERMAINPKTGEKVHVPATKVPRFTPAKDLKEAVKGEDIDKIKKKNRKVMAEFGW
ncbi:MAG: HU family DNA-binding protein, partial [Acinetobacter junii]